MSNPYTPPGSPVKDPPSAGKRSAVGAIALGFVVDLVGTMIVSVVTTFVTGVALAAGGASPAEIAETIQQSSGYHLIGLAGGLACTALGGYVAARFANHSEYANAFAVGVASLVFGEAMVLVFGTELPLWLRLLGDLLVIPAAVVGGHARVLQKRAAATAD